MPHLSSFLLQTAAGRDMTQMTPVETFISAESTAASGNSAVVVAPKPDTRISAVVDGNLASTASQQDANGAGTAAADAPPNDDDEGSKALDLSWPSDTRKRITYVLLAPILWPLWLTLPDTRTPQGSFFRRPQPPLLT